MTGVADSRGAIWAVVMGLMAALGGAWLVWSGVRRIARSQRVPGVVVAVERARVWRPPHEQSDPSGSRTVPGRWDTLFRPVVTFTDAAGQRRRTRRPLSKLDYRRVGKRLTVRYDRHDPNVVYHPTGTAAGVGAIGTWRIHGRLPEPLLVDGPRMAVVVAVEGRQAGRAVRCRGWWRLPLLKQVCRAR